MLDPTWADGLRAELGWLGGALGPVRDLDVLLDRLRADAQELGEPDASALAPLLGALAAERAMAREAMLNALSSRRYTALVARLADAVREPLPGREVLGQGELLRGLVAKEYRRLRKAVRAAGKHPPDDELHALRIHGKRLRYTTEVAAPEIGPAAGELIKTVTNMQDVLGEHQDACVAQQRVRDLLGGDGRGLADGDTAFAAGRLVEREEARRLEARAAWPAAWRAVRDAADPVLDGG
jgi:CHAD domain-containing protein